MNCVPIFLSQISPELRTAHPAHARFKPDLPPLPIKPQLWLNPSIVIFSDLSIQAKAYLCICAVDCFELHCGHLPSLESGSPQRDTRKESALLSHRQFDIAITPSELSSGAIDKSPEVIFASTLIIADIPRAETRVLSSSCPMKCSR